VGVKAALLEVEAGVFAGVRSLIAARAQDATDLLSGRRTLVIAPHPDDETLGCGATIARLRDHGCAVRVVIVTDGAESHQSARISPAELAALRRDEARSACAQLGVGREEVRFLEIPDGQAEHKVAEISARLADEIREFGPEQLIYPSALDAHSDHRAVAAATEQLIGEGSWRGPAYAYPIWLWKTKLWISRPAIAWRLANARAVGVATEGRLERKRQALAAHRSQFENLTGEQNWAYLKSNFTRHFFEARELFFEFGG
jgi:LmbE family N-acetylglucosaminyl deacetylase